MPGHVTIGHTVLTYKIGLRLIFRELENVCAYLEFEIKLLMVAITDAESMTRQHHQLKSPVTPEKLLFTMNNADPMPSQGKFFLLSLSVFHT